MVVLALATSPAAAEVTWTLECHFRTGAPQTLSGDDAGRVWSRRDDGGEHPGERVPLADGMMLGFRYPADNGSVVLSAFHISYLQQVHHTGVVTLPDGRQLPGPVVPIPCRVAGPEPRRSQEALEAVLRMPNATPGTKQ